MVVSFSSQKYGTEAIAFESMLVFFEVIVLRFKVVSQNIMGIFMKILDKNISIYTLIVYLGDTHIY